MATSSTPIYFVLSNQTNASGALFNVDTPTDNGPAMSGSIEVEVGGVKVKVPVSGFLKTATTSGKRYMSLSLGSENGVHYFGKLFRQEQKRFENSPDYTGFITLLSCDVQAQYSPDEWEAADQLQVCGWRVRNADGSARIQLSVASRTVGQGETAF